MLEAMAEAFQDADMWVLWNDAPQRFPKAAESWLAKSPLRRSKAISLPLMPAVWRRIPSPRRYEWMLVSSHLFAHHARVAAQPELPKLVYAHTPARYIWEPAIDLRGRKLAARLASPVIRPLDRARAAEARSIAANSQFVRARIQKTWEVEARVIYPPVDVTRINSVSDWRDRLEPHEKHLMESLPADYVLGASRFVPYKQLDAVIDVGDMVGLPVVLAGSGPDASRLRSLADKASVPVVILEQPSDALLFSLYQEAYVYIFPAIEDFGIMPVEAMACGTPVMVNSAGGAVESIRMCEGGVAMESCDPDSVREAFQRIGTIDRLGLPQRAEIFSRERFVAEVHSWTEKAAGTVNG